MLVLAQMCNETLKFLNSGTFWERQENLLRMTTFPHPEGRTLSARADGQLQMAGSCIRELTSLLRASESLGVKWDNHGAHLPGLP